MVHPTPLASLAHAQACHLRVWWNDAVTHTLMASRRHLWCLRCSPQLPFAKFARWRSQHSLSTLAAAWRIWQVHRITWLDSGSAAILGATIWYHQDKVFLEDLIIFGWYQLFYSPGFKTMAHPNWLINSSFSYCFPNSPVCVLFSQRCLYARTRNTGCSDRRQCLEITRFLQ